MTPPGTRPAYTGHIYPCPVCRREEALTLAQWRQGAVCRSCYYLDRVQGQRADLDRRVSP